MINLAADRTSSLYTQTELTLEAEAEEAYSFLSYTPAFYLVAFLLLPLSVDVFWVKNTHSTPTQACVFQ